MARGHVQDAVDKRPHVKRLPYGLQVLKRITRRCPLCVLTWPLVTVPAVVDVRTVYGTSLS